jgi:hypothetical protein
MDVPILTPDQRVRVFVSSTLESWRPGRAACSARWSGCSWFR